MVSKWALPTLCWAALTVSAASNILEVRLLNSVSSRTAHVGDPVYAIVIAPLEKDGELLIPSHSLLSGRVVKVQGVGIGLRRERASMELEFFRLEFPDRSVHPVETHLITIHNARETVLEDGRIKGILATAGAPGFLMGMWSRPLPSMFARTSVGFAGVSHFIAQSMGLPPGACAGFTALRMALVPFPEPEILLEPGVEMALRIDDLPSIRHLPSPPGIVSEPLWLLSTIQPLQTSFAGTGRDADITNLLFVGSKQQLQQAFRAAGWNSTDPLTTRSVMKVYGAMTRRSSYRTAPVSTILLEGKSPDFVFQKSFNTIAKRHHIRIWRRPERLMGEEVWTGAATHDIGIQLGAASLSFTHKIDPAVDTERTKIINDLSFAGCTERVDLIDRPLESFPGDVTTDGQLAAITLRDCDPDQAEQAPLGSHLDPPPIPHRLVRRMILESKHSLLRGNVYYWGFMGLRKCFRSSNPKAVTP